MSKQMRSREEIEYELQDATVSFIKEKTNPYPIPLQPVLEVLLDIRDLLQPKKELK